MSLLCFLTISLYLIGFCLVVCYTLDQELDEPVIEQDMLAPYFYGIFWPAWIPMMLLGILLLQVHKLFLWVVQTYRK